MQFGDSSLEFSLATSFELLGQGFIPACQATDRVSVWRFFDAYKSDKERVKVGKFSFESEAFWIWVLMIFPFATGAFLFFLFWLIQ